MNPIKNVREAADFLSMSTRHLQWLDARGEGPDKVQLGPRRLGYTDEALAKWVNARSVASKAA